MAIKFTTPSNPNVPGTSGDDFLYGDGRPNIINGFAGSDWLYGYGGNDALFGGANNDYLFGGDGNDQLRGEAGNDRLTGGKGADAYYFNRDGGKDIVTDFNPSEGDTVIFGDGVSVQSYQEFDANGDQKIDKTVVYLSYAGDTSGKLPDYVTFLYASRADIENALFV